jgi:hypothetical protein
MCPGQSAVRADQEGFQRVELLVAALLRTVRDPRRRGNAGSQTLEHQLGELREPLLRILAGRDAAQEHQARHELSGFSWQFWVNGKQYAAKLSRDEIISAPDWSPSSSLPFTLAKAEQIARAELRKLVSNDSTWEVTEVSLQRLREEVQPKWYYLIKFMPKNRESNVIPDLFVFPISLSGEPGHIILYEH